MFFLRIRSSEIMMLDKASHLAGQEGMSGHGHFGSSGTALTNLQPGDVVPGRFQAAGDPQEPPRHQE